MIRRAIGGGIGLAQEAYYHNKDKKAKDASDAQQSHDVPLATSENPQGETADVILIDDEAFLEVDDAQWSDIPPTYESLSGEDESEEYSQLSDEKRKPKKTPKKTLDLFITGFEGRHPGILQQRHDPSIAGCLSLPIVLPQRRPTSRSRGFVRGYPPILEPRNIDVVDWFDFLDTLDQAIKTTPLFWVVNAALKAGHLIPSVWIHFVIMAAHAGVETARRYKMVMNTNNFLAEANERFFKPLGLFCLLMQYNPESTEAIEAVDVQARMKEIAMTADKKTTDNDRSTTRRFADKLRIADGKSLTELELPEAAELVFPETTAGKTTVAGEAQVDGKVNEDGEQPSRWARTKAFTADYYDRRSQAAYNTKNPDSKLTVTADPTFRGRWADPNSSTNNGSAVALLTGGVINLRSFPAHRTLARVRGRGVISKVKRVIEGKVIYLVVTDMPTEEEMRQAEAEMAKEGLVSVQSTMSE